MQIFLRHPCALSELHELTNLHGHQPR
jgi:hypothetical protein